MAPSPWLSQPCPVPSRPILSSLSETGPGNSLSEPSPRRPPTSPRHGIIPVCSVRAGRRAPHCFLALHPSFGGSGGGGTAPPRESAALADADRCRAAGLSRVRISGVSVCLVQRPGPHGHSSLAARGVACLTDGESGHPCCWCCQPLRASLPRPRTTHFPLCRTFTAQWAIIALRRRATARLRPR